MVNQLVCVKLEDVVQNELETGVAAENAKILSSPVAENCKALLILKPVEVYPGACGSPVMGLNVPHLVFAKMHDVTLV